MRDSSRLLRKREMSPHLVAARDVGVRQCDTYSYTLQRAVYLPRVWWRSSRFSGALSGKDCAHSKCQDPSPRHKTTHWPPTFGVRPHAMVRTLPRHSCPLTRSECSAIAEDQPAGRYCGSSRDGR